MGMNHGEEIVEIVPQELENDLRIRERERNLK